MDPVAATVIGRPQLPVLARYVGYEYEGFRRRAQIGLPSTRPKVIISLADPVATLRSPDPSQDATPMQAFVVGPTSAAAEIDDPGHGHGVTIELDPLVLSDVFGLPIAELTDRAIALEDLLPPSQHTIAERLAESPDWPSRFCILDEVLGQRLNAANRSSPDLRYAWQQLTQPEPPSISEIAAMLGWSRRHFTRRFTNRVGLTPTQLRRVGRIERSAAMLIDGRPIADVANGCGFFDQAHMTNEWKALVSRTPRTWIASTDEGAAVLDVRPSSA